MATTSAPKIEVLPNKNRSKKFISHHVFSELTSLCPTTKFPDFYTVKVTYEPDKLLPELKSLKFYFLAFRDREILHEELANEITDDLVESIKPRWIQVVLKVNNRGGVFTTVARRWSRKSGDELIDPGELASD